MTTPQAHRLERLLARDEIREVLYRLARGTDRCDAALIESCYHEDAYDDHGGFQGRGDEFAKWVIETLPEHFATTMHSLANSHIDVEGDTAFSETYCTAHHVMHPDENGVIRDSVMGLRYVDRFEKRNDKWLIAQRVCVYDWTYIVEAKEAWPLEPPFIQGSRGRADPSYALLAARARGGD